MEVRGGREEDFRRIFENNYSVVVRVVYHMIYDTAASEDIAQEVFERFYVKNSCFPSDEDAKYWLLRVAKNLSFNYMRKAGNEKKAFGRLEPSPGRAENHFAIEESDILSAIERLPETLSSPLKLKVFSELDYRGISKVLGISISAVKVRIFRARKELLKILAEEGKDVHR